MSGSCKCETTSKATDVLMPLTTGATLPLPAGFEGFVVRKAPATAGEAAGRTWQTDGRFSKITCVTYSGDERDE